MYENPNLPIHPNPPFSPFSVHKFVLYFYFANRFFCTIFLDSIYMHEYIIFVFLFLTYFTLYDSL